MRNETPSEKRLNSWIAARRAEGLEVTVEVKPESEFFGESITASIFHSKHGTVAMCFMTLRKGGKLCTKNTSLKKSGFVNGKKVGYRAAYFHFAY